MWTGRRSLWGGRSRRAEQRVLDRAATLIEREAAVLRECHTVRGGDDWTGEAAARIVYVEWLQTARQLRDMARRSGRR